MAYSNFQIFLKISLAVIVQIVDLALRAIINYFQINIINSLIKKIKTNFIMSKLYLGYHNQNETKNIIIIIFVVVVVIIKGSTGS